MLADPYGCGGLWERYQVVWDAEAGDAAATCAAHPGAALHSTTEVAADGAMEAGNARAVTTTGNVAAAAATEPNAGGTAGEAPRVMLDPGAASTSTAADAAGAGTGAGDGGVCPWELFLVGVDAEDVLKAEPEGLSTQQVSQEQTHVCIAPCVVLFSCSAVC